MALKKAIAFAEFIFARGYLIKASKFPLTQENYSPESDDLRL